MDVRESRVSCGAWIGRKQSFDSSERTKQDALAAGLEILPWDGNTTIILVDQHGRQFALLYPKSQTQRGIERNERITVKIENMSGEMWEHMCMGGIRGDHGLMRKGVNHGGGTKVRSPLCSLI